MDNERPIVTESNEERIRAGETGRHVRYMLIGGLALFVIASIILATFLRP